VLPRCRKGHTACALLVASLMLVLDPEVGHAFKPSTHVWVAQTVLNDVIPDGRVTIGRGEYVVAPDVVAALREHADAYRMGNIGPDAFPDLVVGQMTVHPGIENGWQTDDWLRHLVSQAGGRSREMAFALGYVGHAAADVFAHSYVNRYAGDVFLLTDGEIDVEARHIFLESYIELHNPPLVGPDGRALGPPHTLLGTPTKFVREQLIFSADASREYRRIPTVTPHLLAMREVHSVLRKLEGELDAVTSSALNLQIEFENRAIDLGRSVDDLTNEVAQARRAVEAASIAVQQHQRLIDAQRAIIADADRQIAQLVRLLNDATSKVSDARNLITNIANRLVELNIRLLQSPQYVEQKVCHNKWIFVFLGLPYVVTICETIKVLNPVWQDLTNQLGELQKQQNALLARVAEEGARRTATLGLLTAAQTARVAAELELVRLELISSASDHAVEVLRIARERLVNLERARAGLLDQAESLKHEIDKYRRLTQVDLAALRLFVRNWREDVENAADAYVQMSDAVMRDLLQGRSGAEPMREWLRCWGVVFMAVPQELPQAVCAVGRGTAEIAAFRRDLRRAAGVAGWLLDPVGKIEDIVGPMLSEALTRAGTELSGALLGEHAQLLVGFALTGMDAARLNGIFSRDESGKQLLLIPDIAARVDREMGLAGGKHFDPQRFAPVYNSVILAKLTLLGPDELNRLAVEHGAPSPYRYGSVLYSDAHPFNVLFGMVRSIDGDHQWQEHAPAYPRRVAAADPAQRARQYGHGFAAGRGGMRFWEDDRVRSRVFNQIFIGPLSPAIDTPRDLGLTEVIPSDYEFVRPTQRHPFPPTRRRSLLSRIF